MTFVLSARGRAIFPVAILVVVILASYGKLTTMRGVLITDDVFVSDIMNDGFPYRFFLGEVLRGGELPLWYPPVYGGFPLLARAEAGICYPLNLVLFGVLPPYVALNLVILSTILIAGIGMYLFVREVGGDPAGSLLAAFAFAYSGFLVSHLKHLSMVNSACWLPVGLLALEHAFGKNREGRTAARPLLWLGVVFGVQNLTGHMQIAYYSALVYGAYFLYKMYRRRSSSQASTSARRFFLFDPLTVWFLVAMTAGSLISAIQVIPTYELVQQSQRAGGVTFEYASRYPYDPSSFWSFFIPTINGEAANRTYRGSGIFWEDYGYVGMITLALALFAVVLKRRLWLVRFFGAATVVAFLLVLGKNTPVFEAAFRFVPMMGFFRFPTRFLVVVDAGLAILAGIGLTHVSTLFRGTDLKGSGGSTRWLPAMILLAAAVTDLVFFQLRQNAIVDVRAWQQEPRTATELRSSLASSRLFTLGGNLTHVAAFSAAEGWLGSLQPYIDQREFLQPSLHVLYGFSSPNGYAQLTPHYIVDVWGDQNRPGLMQSLSRPGPEFFDVRAPFKKLMILHNVKFILSPLPIRGEQFPLEKILGKVYVYHNPDLLPRAFVAGRYRVAGNDDESLRLLASPDLSPSRDVVLFENPGFAPEDSLTGSAAIVSSRANEVTVRATSSAKGILVLSDTYYPGWEAELDGKEAAIMRVNHTMRGVVIPGGDHTVRFIFRPRSVMLGSLISLVGLIGTGAGFVVLRRKPG